MDDGLIRVSVDGEEYAFEKFGASKSIEILLKIGKIVGEPLGVAIGAASGGLDKELDPDIIGRAVSALMGKAEHTEVIFILKALTADKALCGDKKINFDQHYSGRLGHLIKVVKAALEVQYGNFFEELLAVLPVRKRAQSPSLAIPT